MPDPAPTAASTAAPALLALNRASLMRGGKTVLADLTLAIHEGEHTAILGPNGSGKSSLMRLVTRQDYPVAHRDGPGPMQILGQDRWDVTELRTQLGVISADLHQAFLQAGGGGARTGREVVLSGFFASQGIFPHQQVTPSMRERAGHALALVEATHLVAKRLEEMSTGEARRILIARALVAEPRALLLDEPTTGLDLVARQHFLEMLRVLARQGRTLILVTHHIEEILPEIQRVILLREGRIFADGPKPEVLTNRTLSELYGTTIHLHPHQGYFTALPGEA